MTNYLESIKVGDRFSNHWYEDAFVCTKVDGDIITLHNEQTGQIFEAHITDFLKEKPSER
jgi:hypothetical protein